ncbi:sporulation histidine kinase inhibitor Sda [Aquibacillus sp. 3ASR75-11]|uniref:Sporulation histidine kinase inhibitor Sda n=1 Tax=Terrihalobacillus insolitus TaxID=2950438 RepID=A0A9X4AMF1_9BACI|nr:sporulation histidine kinase inhibitor Sda [Terrihalobacillus insolitus]MDC3413479.1 sporulation histidine kinase inhibitor Sda [Terrihalobacillus insolitus]MDC3425231.1 sporulation histidine kinase inhibitor Sda [Terrihalobacillus insolitus]
MDYLSDDLLVEVFIKAIALRTDCGLISTLEKEIKEREIDIEDFLKGEYKPIKTPSITNFSRGL